MIILIPPHETVEAGFDRGRRREAEVAARRLDVGETFRDLAGLHRQQFLDRAAAEQALKNGNEVEQIFGPVVAEIVDPVTVAEAVMRRERAADDIVDIGETARC
jgi:hypothetical protein